MNLVFWTDFADGSVMFPLGVAIPVVLAIFGQRRAALAWTAAIGTVWTAMLFLKLGSYTMAALYPDSDLSRLDLITPSGHVASSAAIYGGLAAVLFSGPSTPVRRSVLAAVVVAALIGTTRVLLGAHSLSEVIVGAAVGIAGAAALASLARAVAASRTRLPILATTLLVILLFHGNHANWEETIHDTALRIAETVSAHS